MDPHLATELSYINGYQSGKRTTIARMTGDLEDILDTCANDNGEMICRAIRELINKYKEEVKCHSMK